MRVLILSHLFPNSRDPSYGIFVLEQLKILRSMGVDATVISPVPWVPRVLRHLARAQKYRGISRRETVEGFDVEHPAVPMLPGGHLFPLYGLVYYACCRPLVQWLQRRAAFDLIHAHTVMPDGCAAVLLGRSLRIPVVCTIHGSDINLYPFRSRGAHWVTGWTLRRIDQLIAVSRALRDRISAWTNGDSAAVVRNGADPTVFCAWPKAEARRLLHLPQDKRIVLFVGYLVKAKGVSFLLDAMTHLSRTDTMLYLVGDGPLKETLACRSYSLAIDHRCIFAGACKHSEVPLWLSAADCLVLPSVTEGLPTILVEAMMCGVPIVSTAVGGIPEILHDRNTGLLVPAANPCALANAIAKILDDPDLAYSMAQRAQAEAQEQLTWEANAKKTKAIYARMLASCHC